MSTDRIHMVAFDETLSVYFKELNKAWLQKYFYVEPIDEEILSHPKEYILDKGGYIFFAKIEEEVVGTVALLRVDHQTYELAKMAVDEKFQGQKVGNRLLTFAIEKSREMGAARLVLYSNTTLGPAMHLYQKYGFVEVPLESSEYKRSNIKMEKFLS